MCGLVGILDPRGARAADVRRMMDAVSHRGPDDADAHVAGAIGLGFRRLSIIDLDTGRQPLANEDGSIRVVFNGEIYNYRELRASLVKRGHVFRTKSDTEVLVHLYEERGSDLVQELRGMFAFAIWDGRAERLLLARDHLGQKPLYWAHHDGRLLFASEIKAILAAAPGLRRVDPEALDEYFALRIIAEPRSMFAGVHKLPAAHVLEATTGGTTVRCYWRLQYGPKRSISLSSALEEIDEAVRQTVASHLVSDVPVGAFLSGGVDSGIVASVMRDVSGPGFKTFCVGVPYGEYDEAPTARRVAEALGTEHIESSVTGDLIALLPRLVHQLDEPSDPLSACMYQLAEMTSRHVKVALGGDGGDELFGGYDRYYGVQLARYFAALPRALRRLAVRRASRPGSGFWYKSAANQLQWLEELAGETGGRRYARSLGYFYFTPRRRERLYSDTFKRELADFDAEESIIRWHDRDASADPLDRMLLADTAVRMPNHSVMILDRMTMAHGLEVRSPFLDHRLVERVAALPSALKVRGRRRRILQMRLAKRYLPAEVLSRPKQGFSSALPYLMANQFRALFGHFLHDSRLVAAGWLREDGIRPLIDAHLSGREDHANRLWLLLNAEMWYRVHIERDDVDSLTGELLTALGRPAPRAQRVSAYAL